MLTRTYQHFFIQFWSLLGDSSSDSLQMQTDVHQTIYGLLRTLAQNFYDFQDTWSSLASAFYDVLQCLWEKNLHLNNRPTAVAEVSIASKCTGRARRPSFQIPQEMLEDLRGFGFSWQKNSRYIRSVEIDHLQESSRVWSKIYE